MIPALWNWLRRNHALILLVAATLCLVLALGEFIQGITWSLLMPVSLSAALCGWGGGTSRLTSKQAWASLTAVGVLGVFVYSGGLILPIGQLVLAAFSIIPQTVLWISKRVMIDFSLLVMTWTDLSGQITNLLTRLWDWGTALVNGMTVVDPVVTALVWSIILWLVGTWAGCKGYDQQFNIARPYMRLPRAEP